MTYSDLEENIDKLLIVKLNNGDIVIGLVTPYDSETQHMNIFFCMEMKYSEGRFTLSDYLPGSIEPHYVFSYTDMLTCAFPSVETIDGYLSIVKELHSPVNVNYVEPSTELQ